MKVKHQAMQVRCDSKGWHVVAEWFGTMRTVFRPDNGFDLVFFDLQDCIRFTIDLKEG